MGQYTPNAQVWYPDTSDGAELNTLFATMASSIEDGVGSRLKKQEQAVACQVSLEVNQNISVEFVVQYNVNSGPTYNNGLTVNAAGSVTIITPGIYFVSTNVYTQQASGFTGYCVPNIRKNASKISTSICSPTTVGSNKVGVSSITTAAICNAGDTLDVLVTAAGGTTTLLAGNDKNLNTFTVALMRAT